LKGWKLDTLYCVPNVPNPNNSSFHQLSTFTGTSGKGIFVQCLVLTEELLCLWKPATTASCVWGGGRRFSFFVFGRRWSPDRLSGSNLWHHIWQAFEIRTCMVITITPIRALLSQVSHMGFKQFYCVNLSCAFAIRQKLWLTLCSSTICRKYPSSQKIPVFDLGYATIKLDCQSAIKFHLRQN